MGLFRTFHKDWYSNRIEGFVETSSFFRRWSAVSLTLPIAFHFHNGFVFLFMHFNVHSLPNCYFSFCFCILDSCSVDNRTTWTARKLIFVAMHVIELMWLSAGTTSYFVVLFFWQQWYFLKFVLLLCSQPYKRTSNKKNAEKTSKFNLEWNGNSRLYV